VKVEGDCRGIEVPKFLQLMCKVHMKLCLGIYHMLFVFHYKVHAGHMVCLSWVQIYWTVKGIYKPNIQSPTLWHLPV